MPMLILYLILINAVTFLAFASDKQRAIRGAWRISEMTLFALSILGGSIGGILAMQIFRHKTKKWKFKFGLPVILAVQIAILIFTFPKNTPDVEQHTPEKSEESVMERLPEQFVFTSGVGAWNTVLTLEEDGSFSGRFMDSDDGDVGKKYKNGTVYVSNFKGQFTIPTYLDSYTYSMKLKHIETEKQIGEVAYKDNQRIIYSGPYGLEKAEELRIYLPGKPLNSLPEEVLFSNPFQDMDVDAIPEGFYCIHNLKENIGFWGIS